MCEKTQGCQKPENLSGKPEECSREQIKACHGDVLDHPCASQGREKRKEEADK